jgi:hypothetical protein
MKKTRKYKTSKWFRVGVSGPTVDGRTIQPEWLTQMAETYDPDKYGARLNIEHFKGIAPDSTFRAYGDVIALKAEEVEIDGEKRTALYAQIDPTEDLVKLNKLRQKVYSSMEIAPNFAGSGKAYLRGLAVTDDPASLGTEMLEFSARGLTYSAAEEIELSFEEEASAEPGLLEKIKGMFSAQKSTDEARFADIHAAVEEIAGEQVQLAADTGKRLGQAEATLQTLSASSTALKEQFDALTAKLSNTPATPPRAPATGGKGEVVTDC